MYLGDFTLGITFDFHFTTRKFSTGAPFTLAGTPVLSAYEDNSTTQITAGFTLDVDFDGVTGLNHVRLVATSGNGFESGKSYSIVITTGTVDGVSVVGEVVGLFTIERSAAFERLGAPAGASVSADIAAIEAQTDDIGAAGAGLTAIPWNASWDAEVQSEVEDGLIAHHLDHLIGVADPGSIVANNSFLAKLVSKSATAAFTDYDNTTDSLQAIRDQLVVVDDFLDTEVAAILAAVDTEVAAILALLDDARGEPGQGNPPVNPDMATKIDYLYKWTRNKKDNDGSTTKFYADDGTTVDQKQTTSESGGTVTKGEIATGP